MGQFFKTILRQSFDCRSFLLRLGLLVVFAQMQNSLHAAPAINTLQRLNFGVLAISANSSPSQVTLSPQGNVVYGNNMVFVASATPGRYRLTEYPAFTDITVTMPSTTVNLVSGTPGESLTVSAAVSHPLTLRTDMNGMVEFDLGATLTSSGSGLPYADGIYISQPTLTLNFSLESVPQVSYQDIEIDLELRTTLALNEIQGLDFGRLAVFSSATDQASLTLSPSGVISINNAGSARIIRFGNETPGTFRISTGAAFASVTLTLPSGTTYLTHQSQLPSVARFLVNNFVSSPTPGNAKLNAQGALEFQLGATLSTELTGNPFQDGLYSGTFLIDVEY